MNMEEVIIARPRVVLHKTKRVEEDVGHLQTLTATQEEQAANQI